MVRGVVQDARASRRNSDLLILGAAPWGQCSGKAGISFTVFASEFVMSLIS